MAVFHQNLHRHPDETPKRGLTAGDIAFLKSLQKELNTQDPCDTAGPRYWGIKSSRKVYNVDEDIDGFVLYDSSDGTTLADGFKETAEYLNNTLLPERYQPGDASRTQYLHAKLCKDCGTAYIQASAKNPSEQTWNLYDTDDLKDFLNFIGAYGIKVSAYRLEDYIEENAVALTQADMEQHLRRNAHHYPENAHTYCMCGVRCHEYEKLIEILSALDFDSIPLKEN